ncbi:hypothetical protein CRG98_002524, partial [Punica granatum]
RTPAPWVDGSRSPIGVPNPESTGGFDSRSPIDSRSGPPISDLDPSTEVVGVLCGCRRPWWRVWGHRLAAPTPSLFDFSL